MTGTTKSSEGLDPRRRRLLFRSWHLGTRELDLIMGRFADAWIGRMSEPELDEYERPMQVADPDLYAWIAGQEAAPASHDGAVLRRLRTFYFGSTDSP